MRRFLVPLALALAIVACLSSPAANGGERFRKVVIDPGHGGKDPGSIGHGLHEKDLTLDLALRIEKLLLLKGISAELTRREDRFVDLESRAALAKDADSIFVSLHFNAHPDRSIAGVETLYWPGSEQGRELASVVQGRLGGRLVTRNRGPRPERLKVLELTPVTGILIECGFVTNRWEAQRCGAAWYRQIVAEEIVLGLLRYRAENE
jgi:N-acetylmuramoyl-L-alanine amidase